MKFQFVERHYIRQRVPTMHPSFAPIGKAEYEAYLHKDFYIPQKKKDFLKWRNNSRKQTLLVIFSEIRLTRKRWTSTKSLCITRTEIIILFFHRCQFHLLLCCESFKFNCIIKSQVNSWHKQYSYERDWCVSECLMYHELSAAGWGLLTGKGSKELYLLWAQFQSANPRIFYILSSREKWGAENECLTYIKSRYPREFFCIFLIRSGSH